MKSARSQLLTLLLAGWMCLMPILPALAQGAAAPQALPALLEFDRKNCPVCRASESVILAVKKQYPGRFEVRKIYIDEEPSWFRRYNVAIVPTQIFLDASGREVLRHEGAFSQKDLVKKLRELKFIGD